MFVCFNPVFVANCVPKCNSQELCVTCNYHLCWLPTFHAWGTCPFSSISHNMAATCTTTFQLIFGNATRHNKLRLEGKKKQLETLSLRQAVLWLDSGLTAVLWCRWSTLVQFMHNHVYRSATKAGKVMSAEDV